MAYLVGIVLVLLLFIILHFFTEISLKQKLISVSVFASFVMGAYLFNLNSENRRVHLDNILLEYNNGKTIVCHELNVNKNEFSYSSGTQTFLGIKESKMFGRIISLDACQ